MIKSLITKLANRFKRHPSTINYWEHRYQLGGTSGSGSYNHLAHYKANYINEFLAAHKIHSVIEFGCGDGNQLSLISYPQYTGLDVSPTSIKICKRKFLNDSSKVFKIYNPYAFKITARIPYDLGLSLDVIYHLLENDLYELHMRHLFQSANRFVIIYSSNFEQKQINHERRHKFTNWISHNVPQWKLYSISENPYKTVKDEANQSLSDFFVYKKI